MEKNKLSLLNDDFDLGLAILVIRRNIHWLLLFTFLGAGLSFFVNRYTLPLFESNSTIKIGDKNEVNRVMKFENIYETNIDGELSRLKSKKMLSSAIAKLPIYINYYSKGKFVNTENYSSNPFSIKIQAKKEDIYGRIYTIQFHQSIAIISTEDHDSIAEFYIPVNKWSSVDGMEFNINISNSQLHKAEKNATAFAFQILNKSQIIKDLSSRLDIRVANPKAKTILIKLQDKHPQKAADIINALANEFLLSNIIKKKESANQMISFTDTQIYQINQKLNYYQRLLKPYQKFDEDGLDIDFNTITKELKSKDKIEELELRKSLEGLRKFELALASDASNEELYSLILLNVNNRYLNSVGNRLQNHLSERRNLKYTVTEESYKIKEIDYKIQLEKDDLQEIIKNLVVDIQDNILIVKSRLDSYIISKKATAKNFDHNTDYLHLKRMYDINSEYYSKLLTKKAEYEMVRVGFVSDNEIIEPARTNLIPVAPQKKLTYIIFTGIGFVLGLLIVVFKYLLHNTVSSISDITKHTDNIPILGMVPSYKDIIPVSQLIVDKNPKSLMSESFRSIRSNLQFISNNEGSKVLTVTSTISGEGKTFVAINLGGIIAFSEKKVIILDLDMRKPKTHIGFNVQNTVGMSTLLIGKTSIDECVQKSNLENLHFITAGPIPPNPSELIISSAMNRVIEDLKKRYDVIVIDTPPVGIVTDALPIISKVDYPIYIVRAHFSKKMFLKNIQMLKDTKGVKKLSIILNGSGSGKSYGSYGSKYGYGYGYGAGEDHGYYEENPQKEERNYFNFLKKK